MMQTAITDIIASNSLQETKLSANISKASTLPESSFQEMLVSFQKETKETEPEKIDQTAVKSEKLKEEKTDETKSEKTESKTEKSDNTEKVPEKDEKTDVSENKILSKENKTDKSEKKSGTKADDKLKNEKKTDVKENNESQNVKEEALIRFNQFVDSQKEKSENSDVKSKDSKKPVSGKVSEKKEIQKENNSDVSEKISGFIKEDSSSLKKSSFQSGKDNQNDKSSFEKSENLKKAGTVIDKQGKITVEDQRTQVQQPKNAEKKSELKTELKVTGENSAQMTMEISQNADSDILSLNSQSAASNGSNFQAMLNNQIQLNTPEFVKAGNIVLQNNDKGTIDLVLHPDDLGNVKINLSLNGKELTGHITVTTKEALEVFKDNAQTLREAFIESGFENVDFEVSLGNNGNFNQNGQNGTFGNGSEDNSFMARRAYGNSVEVSSGVSVNNLENSSNFSDYSVNIVA